MKNPSRTGLIIGALSLVLAFAGIFWYIGFTDNSALLKCIPKNASIVVKFDVASIAENANFEDWADLEMFDEIRNSTDNEERAIFSLIKSPESSGINFLNNAYVAVIPNGSRTETMFVMGMSDREEFEETILRFNEDFEIKRNDVLNLVKIGYNDFLVFNDDVILMYYGSGDEEKCESRAKELLTLNKDQSILEDDNFLESESLGGDFSCYMNVHSISTMINDLSPSLTTNMAEINSMMDAYSMRLTLEDNSIHVDYKPFYTEAYQNELDESSNEEQTLTKEDLQYIAPTDPIAFASILLAEKEMDLALKPYLTLLAENQISSQEILASLNGKISISLIEFSKQMVVREEVDYANWDIFSSAEPPMKLDTSYTTMPVFKLNLGVKDAYAADNLMKKIFSNYSLSSQTGNYYFRLLGQNVALYSQMDERYLSISNAPNSFELKTSETISQWEEEILSNRMMGYADLKPKRYEALYTDLSSIEGVLPYWNMFDHLVMRGDRMGSTVDIQLTDGDDGFIWRMVQQINTTYKESKNGKGVNS